MRIARWVLVAGAIGGGCLWAETARPPRTPVTLEEVRQAIRREAQLQNLQDGRWPRPEEVELPVAVAATAARSLRIVATCWDAGRARVQFRLECGEAKQCMPFLAYARVAVAPPAISPGTLAACRATSAQRGAQPKEAREKEARAVLRSGDRAAVVFAGRRLRLATQVTCLERGSEGQVIRVRNQDGRTFRARVAGPGLLQAVGEEP